MKKIFLGPPGSGKGTYSGRISLIRNIPHVSTGDLFRENIKNSTEIGKKAKEFMDKGKLVPDKIVIEMLKQRIFQEDCKKGFILDGFPRTLAQAEMLDKMTKADFVINLVVPEDILIEKICARRTCKNCGNLYNIADINRKGIKMPPVSPRQKGKCDRCGGELIQREDDNEKIIKERLRVYKNQTEPLINLYKNLGILKNINVIGSPEIMVPIILAEIKNFEEKKS